MEDINYYKSYVDFLLKNEKNPNLQYEKFDAMYKVQKSINNVHWVYFDIETTNDVNDHNIRNGKIIELGACYSEDNTFSELCNPGIKITNTHIHKIDDSMISNKNNTEKTLYNFFVYLNNLRKEPNDIIILIGHNSANFDKKVLENHLNNYKFNNQIYENIFIADTLHALKKYVKIKESNLQSVYKHLFNEEYKEKHRALDDSIDLKKIVDKILEINNIDLYTLLCNYMYQINFNKVI